VFKRLRQRDPLTLREDFCGTAALCCEWVRMEPSGKAYGIDLDQPTLDWARTHNLAQLASLEPRVELIRGNVLDDYPFKVDVVTAFNFSYFCLKSRRDMLAYFSRCQKALVKDGLFYLDIFGGPTSMAIQQEETKYRSFTYIWDQASFSPVTGDLKCHIHFIPHDKRPMRRAFTYDWRLWTIPELTDILEEAGFEDVYVYWEGTDKKTGEGNGVYRLTSKGDNSESFVAYVVAIR